MKTIRFVGVIIALLAALAVGGCVAAVQKSAPDLSLRENTKRILLMPMDIELSVLTAGGILEPNAAWTADAKKYIHEAINKKLASQNGALLVDSDTDSDQLDTDQLDLQQQLIKLHEAVGYTILKHKYIEPFKLPSKKNKFDWTLGEKARFLKETYGADYALFVYMRDSYATTGRVAFIIVAAAVGVGVPGGQQVGFASLVDLNTGQIVWFNRLVRAAGDLRTMEKATLSVDQLLLDFPT